MGIAMKCKLGYSKIRSDFGKNKINVKTYFAIIVCLCIVNLWQTCSTHKTQTIYINNHTKEIIKPVIVNRIDTIVKYIHKKDKKLGIRKSICTKKVNYTNRELKMQGFKTYTTSCIIGVKGNEKCNLYKCK